MKELALNDSLLVRVPLTGNPHSGKAFIFNARTGARQLVRNCAGVAGNLLVR